MSMEFAKFTLVLSVGVFFISAAAFKLITSSDWPGAFKLALAPIALAIVIVAAVIRAVTKT